MALISEDGTGLDDANGYVAVAFVDTYHSDRLRTDWEPLPTAAKEAAIIRATDYIDWRFGRKFRGSKQSKSQGLEWPRLSAFDNDGFLLNDVSVDAVPRQLQKACAEYALIAIRQGELSPNPPLPTGDETLDGTAASVDSSNSGIATELSEKIGPLEVTTKYADRTKPGTVQAGGRSSQSFINSSFYLPEYPRADGWLLELLVNPSSRRLARG